MPAIGHIRSWLFVDIAVLSAEVGTTTSTTSTSTTLEGGYLLDPFGVQILDPFGDPIPEP